MLVTPGKVAIWRYSCRAWVFGQRIDTMLKLIRLVLSSQIDNGYIDSLFLIQS